MWDRLPDGPLAVPAREQGFGGLGGCGFGGVEYRQGLYGGRGGVSEGVPGAALAPTRAGVAAGGRSAPARATGAARLGGEPKGPPARRGGLAGVAGARPVA